MLQLGGEVELRDGSHVLLQLFVLIEEHDGHDFSEHLHQLVLADILRQLHLFERAAAAILALFLLMVLLRVTRKIGLLPDSVPDHQLDCLVALKSGFKTLRLLC